MKTEMHFIVTEYKKLFLIKWIIPESNNLAEFLYLMKEFGGIYKVRPAIERETIDKYSVELEAVSGLWGEYRDRLLYSLSQGFAYRLFSSTHYLTQHGLDGIPERLVNTINHPKLQNLPRFEVQAKDGLFVMTPNDWYMYFASGRNSQKLTDLAIGTDRKAKKSQQEKIL